MRKVFDTVVAISLLLLWGSAALAETLSADLNASISSQSRGSGTSAACASKITDSSPRKNSAGSADEYAADPFDADLSESQIKSWNAEVVFNIKTEPRTYHSHDDPIRNGRNFENRNTFSGELQRLLEIQHQPVRSEATVGGYINQDLDHFNAADKRKWKQYFFYNTHNYRGTGLNYLMLGGEGPVYESQVLDNSTMFMIWARQHGANAYALEHRFYGDSQPTGSMSVASLLYLNSEQALADAAVFIKSIDRANRFTKSKWIVFGGSYPGNLAAWLRQRYPHLVAGAVASSAPVEARHEFTDYYQVIDSVLSRYGNPECLDNVRTFMTKAPALVRQREGRTQLGICKSELFDNKEIDYYLEAQISQLAWQLQSDSVDHRGVNATCRSFSELAARVRGMSSKTQKARSYSCTTYSYRNYVKDLQNPRTFWYRAWLWQTCTQFGYFQTITDAFATGIFKGASIPYDYYTGLCQDVFGAEYIGHDVEHFANRTNQIYGGSRNYNGSNVVFVNGSEDPWHPLSITAPTPRPDVHAIFIPGTSHCRDMYSPRLNDPPALTSARAAIADRIVTWTR